MAMVNKSDFTKEEMELALRNPGMQLEGLRYPITPVGMHYLFTHFDVPTLDPETYTLTVQGDVHNPLALSLEDLKSRPAVTFPSMMECAGTGRAHLYPRPISAPWHDEAVGCAEWTGTPLWPIVEEAGLLGSAVELIFTGYDQGIEDDIQVDYERSLTLEDALHPDVMLAYEINGNPLPPTHGFPLRLIVPNWYGMAQVKWLKSITAVSEPYKGLQNSEKYRYRQSAGEEGDPVTRMNVQALMIPPGIPAMIGRTRHMRLGRTLVEGRAWSGFGSVQRVDFSVDGGHTWADTKVEKANGTYVWSRWSFEWEPLEPGEYELCVRATDSEGNTQPQDNEEVWNRGGYGVNLIQRVKVRVA